MFNKKEILYVTREWRVVTSLTTQDNYLVFDKRMEGSYKINPISFSLILLVCDKRMRGSYKLNP